MKKADMNLHARLPLTPLASPSGSPRHEQPLPLMLDTPSVSPERAREELERLFNRPDSVGQMFRKPAVWPPAPESMSPRSREEVLGMRRARAQHEADKKAGKAPDFELILDDGSILRKGERVQK